MSAEILLGCAGVGLFGAIAASLVVLSQARTGRFLVGYLLGCSFALGLLSLGLGAYTLGDLREGLGATVLLVTINVIVQPLCLLLFVGGAYKMAMAFLGRVTHAFRTAPPGIFSEEQYRSMLTHCIMSGLVGISFSSGLAYVCLRPLL